MPDIEAREGAEEMEYVLSPQNSYQEMLRSRADKVYNNKAMNHSKRMVKRFESMSWGDSVSDVPEHLKPLKRNEMVKFQVKFMTKTIGGHPDKPCHTITASFYANFVHPYKTEISLQRRARVQSFPDWFFFKATYGY